jgi:flagellar biosynthetic protein FliQ
MLSLARAALILLLTIAGPMLLVSLIVGVVIGIVQALTQIQEMTLTFVPKLIALGVVLLLSLPMIGAALSHFMSELSARIIGP